MDEINFFADYNITKKISKTIDEDKKRYEYLKDEIAKHNKLYYEEDTSKISDYDYDKLTKEYRDLEEKYPNFIDKTSHTQKIGGKTKSSFKSVYHEVKMESLQDVFTLEDVTKFINKIKEIDSDAKFTVETKVDGLSISLDYESGRLICGSTRGDGTTGEDVTENIKVISTIPHSLTSRDTIEVRGEVYLPKSELERLNEIAKKQGKKEFANTRNTAAGTLRQLDTDLVKERNLDIFIFNVQASKTKTFKSHSESIRYLKDIGFNTIEYIKVCSSNEEVLNSINEIDTLREKFKYDIDGAVVKVDSLALRDRLGSTVKVPKWAVAYKYPPEQKETKILDIMMQVGRTGKVTPMVSLEPVKISGSTVSSATLHNFDYMEEKDIRIGDIAVIQKAGEIIPEVVKVIKEKRTGNEVKIEKPVNCPVCNEKLEYTEDIVDIRCTNSECPALIYRSLVHFVSRDCMDISGLGESIIETLIEENKINDVADIYTLTFDDFFNLENFKEKSSNNLINAINKSKNNTLDKLIFGLGIRNVGKKASKVLSNNFNDIYEIINADVQVLEELDDFGKIMAESVYTFFRKPKTIEIIEKLNNAGVNLKGSKEEAKSNKLEGLNFCVTGSFTNYSRNEIVKMVEENLGKSVSSVSKKTSYLIAGEDSGSKYDKATTLNVPIITIEQFLDMIK